MKFGISDIVWFKDERYVVKEVNLNGIYTISWIGVYHSVTEDQIELSDKRYWNTSFELGDKMVRWGKNYHVNSIRMEGMKAVYKFVNDDDSTDFFFLDDDDEV